MKILVHSGLPHSFMSGTSGPLSSSTACRATVDSACAGVASVHRPSAVSCGIAGGVRAASFTRASAPLSYPSPARRAVTSA